MMIWPLKYDDIIIKPFMIDDYLYLSNSMLVCCHEFKSGKKKVTKCQGFLQLGKFYKGNALYKRWSVPDQRKRWYHLVTCSKCSVSKKISVLFEENKDLDVWKKKDLETIRWEMEKMQESKT